MKAKHLKPVLFSVFAATLVISLIWLISKSIPEQKYKRGLTLMDRQELSAAKAIFANLGDYRDSIALAERCNMIASEDSDADCWYFVPTEAISEVTEDTKELSEDRMNSFQQSFSYETPTEDFQHSKKISIAAKGGSVAVTDLSVSSDNLHLYKSNISTYSPENDQPKATIHGQYEYYTDYMGKEQTIKLNAGTVFSDEIDGLWTKKHFTVNFSAMFLTDESSFEVTLFNKWNINWQVNSSGTSTNLIFNHSPLPAYSVTDSTKFYLQTWYNVEVTFQITDSGIYVLCEMVKNYLPAEAKMAIFEQSLSCKSTDDDMRTSPQLCITAKDDTVEVADLSVSSNGSPFYTCDFSSFAPYANTTETRINGQFEYKSSLHNQNNVIEMSPDAVFTDEVDGMQNHAAFTVHFRAMLCAEESSFEIKLFDDSNVNWKVNRSGVKTELVLNQESQPAFGTADLTKFYLNRWYAVDITFQMGTTGDTPFINVYCKIELDDVSDPEPNPEPEPDPEPDPEPEPEPEPEPDPEPSGISKTYDISSMPSHGTVGFTVVRTDISIDNLSIVSSSGSQLYFNDFSSPSAINDFEINTRWNLTTEGVDQSCWALQNVGGESVIRTRSASLDGEVLMLRVAGSDQWSNYTLSYDVCINGGEEGWFTLAMCTPEDYFMWNVGGWGNTCVSLENMNGPILIEDITPLKQGVWYHCVQKMVNGTAKCEITPRD